MLGIGWFVGHAFILFPALSEVDPDLPIHAVRYQWLLDGDWQQIADHLAGPVMRHKLVYLVELLLPLAFVPLLAPTALIPALPTLALSLLSACEEQGSIYLHYNAPVIPALMVAAVFGLAWLEQRFKHGLRLGVFILACTSLLAWIAYNPLFGSAEKSHVYGWEAGAHRDALNEVKDLIPADACVVAENNIQPHYSTRRESYVIGARGTGPVGDADGCTYMIVDLGDHRFDDFVVNEDVACYQFWSQKRAPIYFRDTVVVLQWGLRRGRSGRRGSRWMRTARGLGTVDPAGPCNDPAIYRKRPKGRWTAARRAVRRPLPCRSPKPSDVV